MSKFFHDLELTDEERRRYREDGFFARAAVFGADDLESLRAAAERVAQIAKHAALVKRDPLERADQPGGDEYRIDGNRYVDAADATVQYEHAVGSETIRVIEPFHHLDPVFEAFVADQRLVVPLCGVLESDQIALWTDKLNLKRPREGSGFRWHQDSPYWSHACSHCDQLPNVMITLDDADRANGCFRVIRGSHAKGFLPGIHDGTELGPLFTDPESFDEGEQWLAELPAGSLVVFSAHTVHGSQPNDSDRARRAIVLTYQPPDHPMFKLEGAKHFDRR